MYGHKNYSVSFFFSHVNLEINCVMDRLHAESKFLCCLSMSHEML